MKTIPPSLQAHLDSGTTTMAYCWKITRKDGLSLGFTEHDVDLIVDGITYSASTGITASNFSSSIGFSSDNLTLNGVLNSASLTSDDILAGKYDNAEINLFWVNWQDPTQYVHISRGFIGEIKETPIGFEAEFLSLRSKLDQTTGRIFQRFCDAQLGDARCKVDMTSSNFTKNGVIIDKIDNRHFKTNLTDAVGFYANGIILFASGLNNGLRGEIKSFADGVIILWSPMPYDVHINDTIRASAGCLHDDKTCRTKFNNIVNYQGFIFIPGNDTMQSYPVTGKGVFDGGSLFNR